MNILMFLIGTILFTLFITGQIWERKEEKKEEEQYLKRMARYYERYDIQRKKNPKRKKGSQSRLKNYNWKKDKL